MKYTDLLKARNKGAKVPTLKIDSLAQDEQARADQGVCIKCGLRSPGRTSFICSECEDEVSTESIQNDIRSLRRDILEKDADKPR